MTYIVGVQREISGNDVMFFENKDRAEAEYIMLQDQENKEEIISHERTETARVFIGTIDKMYSVLTGY